MVGQTIAAILYIIVFCLSTYLGCRIGIWASENSWRVSCFFSNFWEKLFKLKAKRQKRDGIRGRLCLIYTNSYAVTSSIPQEITFIPENSDHFNEPQNKNLKVITRGECNLLSAKYGFKGCPIPIRVLE